MGDDKMQPNVNDRPEQAKPEHEKLEQVREQAQPSQGTSAAQPGQRMTADGGPFSEGEDHPAEATTVVGQGGISCVRI